MHTKSPFNIYSYLYVCPILSRKLVICLNSNVLSKYIFPNKQGYPSRIFFIMIDIEHYFCVWVCVCVCYGHVFLRFYVFCLFVCLFLFLFLFWFCPCLPLCCCIFCHISTPMELDFAILFAEVFYYNQVLYVNLLYIWLCVP